MLLTAPQADKTFVIHDGKRFTYGELTKRAYQLSNALIDFGVKEKEKVAIMLYNSNEWLGAFFAPMIIGGYAVPTNWHAKGTELEYLFSHSDSKTLIVGEEFVDKILPIKHRLEKIENFVVGKKAPDEMILYEDLIEQSSPEKPKKTVSGMNILMYTGGTTGKPKASDYGAGLLSSGPIGGVGGGDSKKDKLDAMRYQSPY